MAVVPTCALLTCAYRMLDSASVSQLYGCGTDLISVDCAYHMLPRCWTVCQSVADLSSIDLCLSHASVGQLHSCGTDLSSVDLCLSRVGQVLDSASVSQLHGCGTDLSSVDLCLSRVGQVLITC